MVHEFYKLCLEKHVSIHKTIQIQDKFTSLDNLILLVNEISELNFGTKIRNTHVP